jgi:hypothetical protein
MDWRERSVESVLSVVVLFGWIGFIAIRIIRIPEVLETS